MRKPNKILTTGMVIIGLTLLLKHFHAGLPDFAEGFMIGIGLALELAGIFNEKESMIKLRNFKLRLLKLFSQKA
ncbi:MAG: hypothetical protein ACM3P0_10260 [Acidobacteriota bacterium]